MRWMKPAEHCPIELQKACLAMTSRREYQRMSERPEMFYTVASSGFEVADKPLGAWERLYDNSAVRKIALLILLAAVWEGYGRWLANPLLFPTLSDTIAAFVSSIASGALPRAAGYTIKLLLTGYIS